MNMIDESGYRFTDVENGYVDADLAEVFVQKDFTGYNKLQGVGGNAYRTLTNKVGAGGTSVYTNISHEFKFIDVFPGISEVFAINNDGSVYAWGNNSSGSLGLNNTVAYGSPVSIPSISTYKSISCANSTAIVKEDGTLWVCGVNSVGELGLNDRINRSTLTQVGTETNWKKAVVSPASEILCLKNDGTVWLAGSYSWNNGSINPKSTFTQLNSSTEYVDIITCQYRHYALDIDGKLYSCGLNRGALASDTTATSNSSDLNWRPCIPGEYRFNKIYANSTITIVDGVIVGITKDNQLVYAGNGSSSGLFASNASTLTLVSSEYEWRELAVMDGGITGVTMSGEIFIWGGSGFLGNTPPGPFPGIRTMEDRLVHKAKGYSANMFLITN